MSGNDSKKIIDEFFFAGFDSVESPVAVGLAILIFYILIMIFNTANIGIILMDKRLHQPMYLFICNLAIVDMAYCTCSCPTMIAILLVGYKTIFFIPCMLQMYVFHFTVSMEMFTIVGMSFDRFVAIRMPLRYSSLMTNLRCVVIIIFLWLVNAVLLSILPASVAPLSFCYSKIKHMFCDYSSVIRASCADPVPYFNNTAVFTSCLIFVSFSFICLSYINIFIVVSRMTSNNVKKKAVHTCLSHIIVIVCYYVPNFIRMVLTRHGVVLTLEERNGLMVMSIIVPSLVNPFIYCFRNKEIKNKLFKIFLKIEPIEKGKQ